MYKVLNVSFVRQSNVRTAGGFFFLNQNFHVGCFARGETRVRVR
jgi:hypothetical protein